MSSKVKFNTGEGVVASDFGNLQDYQRKMLFDSVLLNLAADAEVTWNDLRVGTGLRLRPLGSAGFLKRQGANTVRVNGGLWVAYTAGTAADPNAPTAKIANKDTTTDLTIANAPATQFRRDIIQCQLVEADEAAISRHFKDAVTGALSSATQVKRANISVTYAVKAGTAQASAALANANEPTADAGWVKIASVLASSTGLDLSTTFYSTDYWDWREPWGSSNFGHTFVGLDPPQTNWTYIGIHSISSTVSAVPVYLFMPDLNANVSDTIANCRVFKIGLAAAWGGTPAAGTFVLHTQAVDLSLGFGGVATISFIGATGDVSTRVDGTSGPHLLYGGSADPPLWSGGYPNAYTGLGRRKIYLRCDPQGAASKSLSGVIWQTMGTF